MRIYRAAVNGLINEAWDYYVSSDYRDSIMVRLTSYAYQTRTTKRHKFRTDEDRSYAGHHYRRALRIEDVPQPADVKAEVVRRITEGIVFV